VPTLAAILAAEGFATVAIVQSHWLGERHGLPRGFESWERLAESVEGGRRVGEEAVAWLEAHSARPFFLFLHYYDLHSDYAPAPRHRERFTSSYDGPVDGTTAQLLEVRAGRLTLDERDLRHLSDLYDAGIRQLDDRLAELFARLDELGLRDSTLVVVTSDHGEELGEHGGVPHGRTMHRELLGVPLLLHGPGVPRGRRVRELATLADVVPTVLGRLGIEAPPSDGIDLLAWLR